MSLTPKLLQQGAAGSARANYIEDVFSTYVYAGNGTAQTINNGIDLATKGGLIWIKSRDNAFSHVLIDTTRGLGYPLNSNNSGATGGPSYVTFPSTSGFYFTDNANGNQVDTKNVAWTFRKQPKFFDIVTWTGNGTTQNLSHNLGSIPGMIIIKRSGNVGDWNVWHRSLTAGNYIKLNTTDAQTTGGAANYFGDNSTTVNPTSTTFTVGNNSQVNADSGEAGNTYVAYLFAHNAGGFGLTGTDSVISCGSFTTDGNAKASVTLGWEPQWVLFKGSQYGGRGVISDSIRGAHAPSQDPVNYNSNTKGQVLVAEGNFREIDLGSGTSHGFIPNATGFTVDGNTYQSASNQTFIYIAIRRGPMKVPTVASSVFSLAKVDSTLGGGISMENGDMALYFRDRFNGSNSAQFFDRLRGFPQLGTNSPANRISSPGTLAEEAIGAFVTTASFSSSYYNCPFQDSNNIMQAGFSGNGLASTGQVVYGFRRAPGFFDIVGYAGTASARDIPHNLGVIPEFIIVKNRISGGSMTVYSSTVGTNKTFFINQVYAAGTDIHAWNNQAPTSSVFSVGGISASTNISPDVYIAYLFATCPGVSKVGSYTGNGSTQTIDCGFAAGARLIWIKRTDANSEWYVFDTARGIISGNDPFLHLNRAFAETSSYDAVDPANSGFIVNNDDTNFPVNVASATYFFLAIA
jgi:hypothetical protein